MTAHPEGYLARELELCYENNAKLRELLFARDDPEGRAAAGRRLRHRARGARI